MGAGSRSTPLAKLKRGLVSYSDKPLEIYPGVYITGTIPRRTAYEDAGGRFVLQSGEDLIEDYIEDDMALVIDHPQGLIILSGCAHAGTVNTLEYAREITGKRHIQAYIGGTHLMNASSERMEATLSALLDELPNRIMIGHCAGFIRLLSYTRLWGIGW